MVSHNLSNSRRLVIGGNCYPAKLLHLHTSLAPMTLQHYYCQRAPQLLVMVFWLLANCAASQAQNPDNNSNAGQTSQASAASQPPDQIFAVPNRPTFSTTAESVQSGVFEVEYGLEAGEGHQNINGLLKFGLTKNLELRFANNPIERDGGVAGRGDSGAGFKYKVVEEKRRRPTLSVLYTAINPTATAVDGFGGEGYSAAIPVIQEFAKQPFEVYD